MHGKYAAIMKHYHFNPRVNWKAKVTQLNWSLRAINYSNHLIDVEKMRNEKVLRK